MPVVPPLQKVSTDGVAATSGVGFTVTSKLNGGPSHKVGAGPVGVITYLTTPVEVPELCRVCPMLAGQPEAQSLNPVMVPPEGAVKTEAVQVKVVPETADAGV
jgi:hypothetical protein